MNQIGKNLREEVKGTKSTMNRELSDKGQISPKKGIWYITVAIHYFQWWKKRCITDEFTVDALIITKKEMKMG